MWGSEIYTHDSDLVAVLMHCGYVNSIVGVPKNTVSEALVTLEYLPSAPFYPSVYRNGIRSRAWGHFEGGCSFKVGGPSLLPNLVILGHGSSASKLPSKSLEPSPGWQRKLITTTWRVKSALLEVLAATGRCQI